MNSPQIQQVAANRPLAREGDLKLVVDVHKQLSALISPATPESIRASSIKDNSVLKFIAITGGLGFAFLIFVSIWSEASGSPAQVVMLLQLATAAVLGSAFYSLYTASNYLRHRTFDPQYNQIYMIRFGLGILAGFILGLFAPDLLMNVDTKTVSATTDGSSNSGTGVANVGAMTFALVGGFSAEAVAQILKRFADTLVTMVRGSDKEQVEARADKEMARKSRDVVAALQNLLDKNEADEMHTEIKRVIKEVLK